MKYQRLVCNTTPASLQDWLDDELDRLGIDAVYTRYILSLLQEESMDVDPFDIHNANFKSHQQRVCHKYGGPEVLHCGVKPKHQKWKTWGKQVLLSSNSFCYIAQTSDIEKMRKKAAIDCLSSLTDTDESKEIKMLIDEVCIRLKNVKNTEVETDESSGRSVKSMKWKTTNHDDPPSSPTGESETYFDAFPALNRQHQRAERNCQKYFKHKGYLWCKSCQKKMSKGKICHCHGSKKNKKSVNALIISDSLKAMGNARKSALRSDVSETKENLIIPYASTPIATPKNINKIVINASFPFKSLTVIEMGVNSLDAKYKECVLDFFKNNLFGLDKIKIDQAKNFHVSIVLGATVDSSEHEKKRDEKNINPVLKFSNKFKNLASIWNNEIPNEEKLPSAGAIMKKKSVWCNEDGNFLLFPILKESTGALKQGSDSVFVDMDSEFVLPNKSKPDNEMTNEPHVFIHNLSKATPLNTVNPGFSQQNCTKTKSVVPTSDNKDSLTSEDFSPNVVKNLNMENVGRSASISNPLISYDCGVFANTSAAEYKLFRCQEGESAKVKDNFDNKLHFDNSSNELYLRNSKADTLKSSKIHFQPVKDESSHLNVAKIFSQKSEINQLYPFKIQHGTKYEAADSFDNALNWWKMDKSQELLTEALAVGKEMALVDENKSRKAVLSFGETSKETEKYYWNSNAFSENPELPSPLFTLKHFENNAVGNPIFAKPVNPSQQFNLPSAFVSIADTASAVTDIRTKENESVQAVDNCWGENCYKSSFEKEVFADRKGIYVNESVWGRNLSDSIVSKEGANLLKAVFGDKSEDVTALRQEIKEEEEDLLRGLCGPSDTSNNISITGNYESEFPNGKSKVSVVNLKSNYTSDPNYCTYSTAIPENEYAVAQELSSNSYNNPSNEYDGEQIYVPVEEMFAIHACNEGFLPGCMCCENAISNDGGPYQSSNFFDMECAQTPLENENEITEFFEEDYRYWSNSAENSEEIAYENFLNRYLSLMNSDQHEDEQENCNWPLEEAYPSTMDEYRKMIYAKGTAPRRLKNRRKPCSFFMEGNCRRDDCKYSHDLSSITCRYWQDGSCFKGIMCPFLHGEKEGRQTREIPCQYRRRSRTPDCNYTLESEADFPSLSTENTQASGAKSLPLDIVQDKGAKPKRRKSKLQPGITSDERNEPGPSSSWPGGK